MAAYARAILRGPNRHLADDAVQAALCRILTTSRSAIGEVRDVEAWLMAVVRREALMLLRTHRRASVRERAAAIPLDAHRPPDGPADDVMAAIDHLPRRLREVVALKHVGGLTFDQIALATGVNRNTAASRHRDAMARLRAELGAAMETGSRGARTVSHAG